MNDIFDLGQAIKTSSLLVMADSETYHRMVDNYTRDLPRLELRQVSDKIEALAEIFMYKPELLIVLLDSNQETIDFIHLVRNNPSFKELPIIAIFVEPLKFKHKWLSRLNLTEKFETPLSRALTDKIKEVFELKTQKS